MVSKDLFLSLGELFLGSSLLFLLVFLVLLENRTQKGFYSLIELVCYFSVFVLLIFCILTFNIVDINCMLFNNSLIVNKLISFVKICLSLFVSIFLLSGMSYIKNLVTKSFEFVILILLSLFGMCFFLSSNDFLVMFLGVELQTFCLYILSNFRRNRNLSSEAALKYYILGSLSTGLLVFGCSFVYAYSGLYNFVDLRNFLSSYSIYSEISPGILLGLLFIFVGLLFKIGSAPFHFWVPDVYEGVSVWLMSFFTIVVKVCVFTFFVRFYFCVLGFLMDIWSLYVCLAILCSVFVGSLGALVQINIRRLLAYSSILNGGFLLFGFLSKDFYGVVSVFVYLFIYMLTLLCVFLVLFGLVCHNKVELKRIDSLTNLLDYNFSLSLIFVISLFSIAGIPPLLGFFGKLLVLMSGIQEGFLFFGLVIILLNAIGVFYYIRLIKVICFNRSVVFNKFLVPVQFWQAFFLSYLFLFLLGLIIYPNLVFDLVSDAVLSLYLF